MVRIRRFVVNRTLALALVAVLWPLTAEAIEAPTGALATGPGRLELADGRVLVPAVPHRWRASAAAPSQARAFDALVAELGPTWATWDPTGEHPRQILTTGLEAPGTVAHAAEAERFVAQGAESPFLDVWFADENTGFVVGAFNLILRTTDGGQRWTPWLERTDNPQALHLYAIRPAAGALWVTGEQGLVLRLDATNARFDAVETPYKGSYFGLTGTNDAVIVFGLRGNAYRSTDLGASWTKLDTGLEEGLTAAASDGGQHLMLASQAGRLLSSRDGGAHFTPVKLARPVPASAVLPVGPGAAIVAGARGIAVQTFK